MDRPRTHCTFRCSKANTNLGPNPTRRITDMQKFPDQEYGHRAIFFPNRQMKPGGFWARGNSVLPRLLSSKAQWAADLWPPIEFISVLFFPSMLIQPLQLCGPDIMSFLTRCIKAINERPGAPGWNSVPCTIQGVKSDGLNDLYVINYMNLSSA